MLPGPAELFVLVVLGLLIFGPDKLPGLARTAGRTVRDLRRYAQGTMDEIKGSVDLSDFTDAAKELRGARDDLAREARAIGPLASTSGVKSTSTNGKSANAMAALTPAAASDGEGPAAAAQGAPPFDPYAT